jgi:ABC-type nickel/cobalt efflux system permease component RcnA
MRPAAIIRIFAASVFVVLVIASLAAPAAAQNPFGPKGGPAVSAPQAEQPTPGEAPSFYQRLLERAVTLQRTMVRDIGRYMAAIRDGDGSRALWIGIGFAFLYGVVHTLGPGHGKMIVASYFVGRDAQVWRGLGMGLQIAVTHVVSAVVLVWLVDLTFRQMLGGEPAESWWIRLVSFALIAAIGIFMLVRAIRNTFFAVQTDDHDHEHGHGRDHADHHHGHSHDWHSEGALAFLAGLVPCTGAILVMLFALANGIILAGVLMVVSISLGMAITMAAIGVGAIYFRRVLMRVTAEGSRKRYVVRAGLEYAAALLILAVGLSFLAGTLGERFA